MSWMDYNPRCINYFQNCSKVYFCFYYIYFLMVFFWMGFVGYTCPACRDDRVHARSLIRSTTGKRSLTPAEVVAFEVGAMAPAISCFSLHTAKGVWGLLQVYLSGGRYQAHGFFTSTTSSTVPEPQYVRL